MVLTELIILITILIIVISIIVGGYLLINYFKNKYVRFIKILLPGKNRTLHFAEIHVFDKNNSNIALKKNATSSSVNLNGVANNATDGNTSQNFEDGSMVHTQTEDNPWFEVDLEHEYLIKKIRIFNRKDCCTDRFDPFSLILMDKNKKTILRKDNIKGNAANLEIDL